MNSQRGRGKLNSQREIDSVEGYHVFLQPYYFCGNTYKLLTSLQILRNLDTNRSWLYLATEPSNIVLVGRPVVNVALFSTLLVVQYF